jgi:hypothetical protein
MRLVRAPLARLRRVLVGLAVVTVAACSQPRVDLAEALQLSEVSTGWRDAGIVEGQNKLVPSASFKLKNLAEHPLVTVQVNGVFRRVSEADELGSQFVSVTGSGELMPGATTDTITVSSRFGYTGTEPRAVMLANSNFVDAKVEVSAKYGSGQWVRIADLPIERRLIEQ